MSTETPQVSAEDRNALIDALEKHWLEQAAAKTVDSPRGHCARTADMLIAAGWRPAPTPAPERPDDNPMKLLIDETLAVVEALKGALFPSRPVDEGTREAASALGLAESLRQQRNRMHDQLVAARKAIRIADDTDVTDWQRGYRACADRVDAALASPVPAEPDKAAGYNEAYDTGYRRAQQDLSEQIRGADTEIQRLRAVARKACEERTILKVRLDAVLAECDGAWQGLVTERAIRAALRDTGRPADTAIESDGWYPASANDESMRCRPADTEGGR